MQVIPVPHPSRNLPELEHPQHPFLMRPGLENNCKQKLQILLGIKVTNMKKV